MKKIKINLFDNKSIENSIKEVKKIRNNFSKKCVRYVEELSKAGIIVSKQNAGNYGKYISYSTEIEKTKDGIKGIMALTNTGMIESHWLNKDGEQIAILNPLLFAEFGAGNYAENPLDVEGVGQGTFPGQTHAYEPGWYYKDLNGIWHYSRGVRPTQPILKARQEMIDNAISIGKKVFGE